ncbi:hypothetical protein BGZ99_003575 [Dissophora globulifera]|uniref:C3H1-type domain-containing protein n=1 Tax=Dissophora globulifera TaxID=979702 RepID=A0A9P6RPH6_9FUNG|nr:hypothetical protein BGZ99_003575 [Dissophora globulifera]
MSDKELLAQIAQVAGAINKHMNSQPAAGYATYNNTSRGGYSGMQGRGRGRGAGSMPPVKFFNRKLTLNNTGSSSGSRVNGNHISDIAATLSPISSTPHQTPAATFAQSTANLANRPVALPTRHLSLINNNTSQPNTGRQSSPSTSSLSMPSASIAARADMTTAIPGVPPTGSSGQQWIQSKGKNLSMMNPTSYKKTMEAKQKSIQSSKAKKLKLLQARAKLARDRSRGIVTVGGTEYKKSRDGRKLVMRDSTKDNVVINGLLFEMDPRGNKLVRKGASNRISTGSALPVSLATTPTPQMTPGATPKQFSMGGVDYVRTTNGNLVRATLVKTQLLKKRATQELKQNKAVSKKSRPFCKFFTRFGQCQRGSSCPFVHSSSHLAICKKFLRGTCTNTASTCKLSHTPSPHSTPACSHFQRAACTKDNCLYPHIRINPQAPICRPFATEGWCDAGINCKDRHVWICPDFGTPAGCKKKCGLAHVANGGVRVKRSAEEMEKERQEQGDAAGSEFNSNKRKRAESAKWSKPAGRYMEGLPKSDAVQSEEQDWSGSVLTKKFQHDENFVPFEFDDDDEEEALMAQVVDEDENEVMGDFEGDQELDEEEEEDQEDVSSDEVESDDSESDAEEDPSEDDDDEDESENEAYHEELQRFYEEQDREDDEYHRFV